MLPFSLCVFYLYDELQDVLVAHHAYGTERARIVGLRIPIGERRVSRAGLPQIKEALGTQTRP